MIQSHAPWVMIQDWQKKKKKEEERKKKQQKKENASTRHPNWGNKRKKAAEDLQKMKQALLGGKR